MLHTAFFLRTAIRQKSKATRKRVSSTPCQTCPRHKSLAMLNTCVWRDYWAPVTSTLWHCCFKPRRELTRHKLLSRQPHGNHAQVIHGGGPGCGICHGHVELGCVYRYTPQTIRGCRKKINNDWESIGKGICFKGNYVSRDVRLHLAFSQTTKKQST